MAAVARNGCWPKWFLVEVLNKLCPIVFGLIQYSANHGWYCVVPFGSCEQQPVLQLPANRTAALSFEFGIEREWLQ